MINNSFEFSTGLISSRLFRSGMSMVSRSTNFDDLFPAATTRPFSRKVNLTENHLFVDNWPLKHPFRLKITQIVDHSVLQLPAKDFTKILIFWIFKSKYVKNGQNGPEKTCFSSSFVILQQKSNQSYLYVFHVIGEVYSEPPSGFLEFRTF